MTNYPHEEDEWRTGRHEDRGTYIWVGTSRYESTLLPDDEPDVGPVQRDPDAVAMVAALQEGLLHA